MSAFWKIRSAANSVLWARRSGSRAGRGADQKKSAADSCVCRLMLQRRGARLRHQRVDEVHAVGRAHAGDVVPARAGLERSIRAKGDHEPARGKRTVVKSTVIVRNAIERRGERIRGL